MRGRHILVLGLLALMGASCTGQQRTADSITSAKTQIAIDQSIENLKRQPTKESGSLMGEGQTVVGGVRDNPQDSTAIADITFRDLSVKCEVGVKPFGNGRATFTHYNDGRWVLTKLETLSVENVCFSDQHLNIEVK